MTPRFLYLLKYRICHIPRSYLIDACFSLIGICREFSWDVTYIATFDNLISLSNTCCWDHFTLNFIQHLFELDMSSHVGFAFVSLVFFLVTPLMYSWSTGLITIIWSYLTPESVLLSWLLWFNMTVGTC